MGAANPWSPNWRPDPTGQRLAAIRTARRGAILAAVLLGGVTTVAGLASGTPPMVALTITAAAIPALALLGAGLAPAATGSRIDALVVGVALAIGAPVAAALSSAIAVLVMFAMSSFHALTGEAVGDVIRLGVIAALRVAPLLAAVVAVWVIAIRRLERRALA
jgi:hypothetical protein